MIGKKMKGKELELKKIVKVKNRYERYGMNGKEGNEILKKERK